MKILISFIYGFVFCLFSAYIQAETYSGYELDKNGQLTIITDNQKTRLAPKLDDQVSFHSPRISASKKYIGWLAMYDNCCTSYPIPLDLVIYSGGKIIHRFSGVGMPVWKWEYVSDTQVAFSQQPTHGDFTPHLELHDLRDGKLLQKFDGEVTQAAPAWVQLVDKTEYEN